ncbi:putative lipid-binding protein AIR1B [Punica granatum]|uniref:Lipid-binding protein AIR1B n=2 Tax=Punica granatum TaxID=22663 RepID=A0A6P8DQ75_PUNGR|nr:putative lipid-binding protein AIR1B [Punica granatum]PKI60916.1 hypothetical protein CRG98_018693 [Punica granatum]
MAAKSTTMLALFLSFNLLIFSLSTAQPQSPDRCLSSDDIIFCQDVSVTDKRCCKLLEGLNDLEAISCLFAAATAGAVNPKPLHQGIELPWDYIDRILIDCGRRIVPSIGRCSRKLLMP